MRDFGDKNDDVLKLWISFKGNSVSSLLLWTLVGGVCIIAISIYSVVIINKMRKNKRRKNFKAGIR